MCAVVLGMLWRNSIGVPAWASAGLNWTMHRLLRVGIALVGLRLTLGGATAIAATALPVALMCLCVALAGGLVLARVLAVPRRLGLLLAIGTAVCGCTAVVAMSPVIRARHAETAFAVTCVVLFGCAAMLLYPLVAGYFFAGSPVHAGVFLGTAIHDTSQVMGAALIYSQQAGAPDALAAASVAKLLRNLSIAVLVPVAAWYAQRHAGEAGEAAPAARVARARGTARAAVRAGVHRLHRAAHRGRCAVPRQRLAGARQHRLPGLGPVPHLRHDRGGPVGVLHRHVAHRLAPAGRRLPAGQPGRRLQPAHEPRHAALAAPRKPRLRRRRGGARYTAAKRG